MRQRRCLEGWAIRSAAFARRRHPCRQVSRRRFCQPVSSALILACLVVGVTDGDTLSARCDVEGELQAVTVRLSQIDAPEKRQAWGDRSREDLAALC